MNHPSFSLLKNVLLVLLAVNSYPDARYYQRKPKAPDIAMNDE